MNLTHHLKIQQSIHDRATRKKWLDQAKLISRGKLATRPSPPPPEDEEAPHEPDMSESDSDLFRLQTQARKQLQMLSSDEEFLPSTPVIELKRGSKRSARKGKGPAPQKVSTAMFSSDDFVSYSTSIAGGTTPINQANKFCLRHHRLPHKTAERKFHLGC